MKKFLIIFSLIVVAAFFFLCSPQSSEIPTKYVGFWGYDNGKQIGLYEEFVIYNNDFWKYQNVEESSNLLCVSLCKDSKIQKINVEYLNDSTISLILDDNHKFDCQRTDNKICIIRNYANVDTTGFKPIKDEIDSATILFYDRYAGHGLFQYIDKMRCYKSSRSFVYRWYYDWGTINVKPFDENDHYGFRFKFKVPVQGVTEIDPSQFVGYMRNSPSSTFSDFIVEPGDTLVLVYDDQNEFTYGGTESSYIDNVITLNDKRISRFGLSIDFCPAIQECIYRRERDSIAFETYLDAIKSDLNRFDNFVEKNKFSKKFSKYGYDKIKYYASIFVPEFANSNSLVDEFFKKNVEFNEDELYYNSGVWECSTAWIKYYYCKNNEIDENEIDALYFLKSDFIKDLGFSDTFIERWKVLQSVQYIKSHYYDQYDCTKDLQAIRENFKDQSYRNLFEQIVASYLTYIEMQNYR